MNDKWIAALAKECRRASQADVAAGLGISAAVVNQVLQGKYQGNLRRIKALVEGRFMAAQVDCPVIGTIPLDECVRYQDRRDCAATNPLRVQLHHTCPTCRNSLRTGGNHD